MSADYFPLWSIEPEFGRGLVPADFRASSDRVVVISDHLWQTTLNADASILGRTLILDGVGYRVAGVMPPGVGPFPYKGVEVWRPLLPGRAHIARVLGRLKAGTSLRTARVEAETIAARFSDGSARTADVPLIAVSLFGDWLVEDSRMVLLLLSGSVGLVLLIVCANVANLLLASLTGRQQEVAVRVALGASRTRVVRQLVVQGLLLSGMGAGLGLLAARWAMSLLVSSVPYYVPRIEQSRIDPAALAFTVLLSVIATLLFSIAPTLVTSAPDLNRTLKEGASIHAGGRGGPRLQATLVVAEIAFAMVTLVGTGLLIQTFLVLRPSHPGFDPGNKLTMSVSTSYVSAEQQISFWRSATERVANLPGVKDAAAVSFLPMSGMSFVPEVLIQGRVVAGLGRNVTVHYQACTPDFFRVMRMPIMSGRNLLATDDEHASKVAVINEMMARELWPDKDPVGSRFTVNWGKELMMEFTVVGVVRDSRLFGTTASAEPEAYAPYSQDPLTRTMSFVIHIPNKPTGVTSLVRGTLNSLDRGVVISDIRTMDDILDESVVRERYNAELFGMFGGLALILAMTGIYGVISHAVSHRTHEIGVRMALGAQSEDVLRMVIREGMTLALAGIAAGAGLALALMRFLQSLLFGIKPTDPAIFLAVACAMALVALTACYIPARRAMRVNPVVALRHE